MSSLPVLLIELPHENVLSESIGHENSIESMTKNYRIYENCISVGVWDSYLENSQLILLCDTVAKIKTTKFEMILHADIGSYT